MATTPTPATQRAASLQPWLDYGSSTDRAKRENNEDYVELQETTTGLIALLADGMGGGADGEKFSRQAVRSALAEFQQIERLVPSVHAKMHQVFNAAIREVHALRNSDPRYTQSGSTLVGALIERSEEGFHLAVGNIGDSRAYLIDARGAIRQISHDHTYYEELRSQNVSAAEANAHVQAGRLTHVLGGNLKLADVPQFFKSFPFNPGDTLLLCTDGIYKRVPEEEIVQVLGRGSAQEAAVNLVQLALKKHAQDNVTALVVRHKTAPAPANSMPMLKWGLSALGMLAVVALLGWGLLAGGVIGSNAATSDELVEPSLTVQANNMQAASVTALPPSAIPPTAKPTDTVPAGQPTSTPAPTLTATPTNTPTPTDTPVPTNTPLPPPPPTVYIPPATRIPQQQIAPPPPPEPPIPTAVPVVPAQPEPEPDPPPQDGGGIETS